MKESILERISSNLSVCLGLKIDTIAECLRGFKDAPWTYATTLDRIIPDCIKTLPVMFIRLPPVVQNLFVVVCESTSLA